MATVATMDKRTRQFSLKAFKGDEALDEEAQPAFD